MSDKEYTITLSSSDAESECNDFLKDIDKAIIGGVMWNDYENGSRDVGLWKGNAKDVGFFPLSAKPNGRGGVTKTYIGANTENIAEN